MKSSPTFYSKKINWQNSHSKMKENSKTHILDSLISKYPTFVNPDLIGLTILQDEKTVFIKSIFKDYPEKNALEALDFIADDELFELEPIINVNFFNPNRSVEENAELFINDLDPYSMLMCIDDIFTEDAEREIVKGL